MVEYIHFAADVWALVDILRASFVGHTPLCLPGGIQLGVAKERVGSPPAVVAVAGSTLAGAVEDGLLTSQS